MLYLLIIILSLTFAYGVSALENMVADLSVDHINIDYNFDGIDLAIFGVARQNHNIAIVVYGPPKSFVIRKKKSFLGIWFNKENIRIEEAPVFYSLLSSEFIADTNQELLKSLEIGIHNINLNTNSAKNEEFIQNFRQINKETKMYQEHIGEINFIDNSLFKATISFPDKTPAGRYIISIFSIKDNNVMNAQIMPISIATKGANALVQKLAYKYPMFYSTLVISTALTVGWIANILFRKQ